MTDANRVRPDIQALRGYAVLLVMLDHFGASGFRHGYLGVDIFFVISGFLISSLIAREIREDRFSFRDFYFRRAKRLLPAAYVTILLTSLGGIWFLNSSDLDGMLSQIVGAVTFSINFVLWKQTGYFDLAAASKPLLHLWSLAVEEQFYLFFPLFLYVIPRRIWVGATGVLMVSSFAICVFSLSNSASAAFYLLPSRGWEILIGALVAFHSLGPSESRIVRVLKWPAILLLLIVPLLSLGLPHPGVQALIVCLATALLLADDAKAVVVNRRLWPLIKLGDCSYSVYLVHWPVVVLLNAAFVDTAPAGVRCAAFVAAILLGALVYILIEQPFRKIARVSQRFVTVAVGVAAVLVAIQIAIDSDAELHPDFMSERRPNYGLNQICDSLTFVEKAECQSRKNPAALIWGDSYAMHIAAGLVPALPQGVLQATASSCAPFAIEPAACRSFNASVLEYLRRHQEVATVILAADFRSAGAEALDELLLVIRQIRGLERKIVIVKPPPFLGERNVRCAERKLMKKFVLGENRACEISRQDYRSQEDRMHSIFEELGRHRDIGILDLSMGVCDERACRPVVDGVLIYRDDGGHLTYRGSDVLLEKIKTHVRNVLDND